MELSESLAQFGMTEREPGTLVVACVHNFVVLEYRINAGLLWSRVLLPDGSEFLDGVSDWEALQLEEVLSLMRAKPPIAAGCAYAHPGPGLRGEPVALLEVGKPYSAGRASIEARDEYNFRRGQHELLLCLRRLIDL